MKKMYLLQLIDGGYDSLFLLMDKYEIDQVEDCESEIIASFLEGDDEDRCFDSFSETFKYCKKNNIELVDGFTILQY